MRVNLTLQHREWKSVCWHHSHCPPPVLPPLVRANIESEVFVQCSDAVSCVLAAISATNSTIERSVRVLTSGHAASDCQECKAWYRSWLCLSYWPVYLSARPLLPCPSQCTGVQTSCPFQTIF